MKLSPAYPLGIVSVYSLGLFPLLLQHTSDNSKVFVAICSVIQILCSFIKLDLKGLAFFGALSSCIVMIQPEVSYIMVGGTFGAYYSYFLNGTESPDKALRLEFVSQLAFLFVTAAIFAITNQVEWVIVVAGFMWFVLTPKWHPVEGLQAGTNYMFLVAWAILSTSVSGLLLVAVFIVGGVFDDDVENRAILIGLALVLFGGCISTISFDKSSWHKAMFSGCCMLCLTGLTTALIPWESVYLGLLSYCLGVGIGCVMVSVRSAYAGHYGILLGVQRASEAAPAILLALTDEETLLYASSGSAMVSMFVFWRVSILERQRRIINEDFEVL